MVILGEKGEGCLGKGEKSATEGGAREPELDQYEKPCRKRSLLLREPGKYHRNRFPCLWEETIHSDGGTHASHINLKKYIREEQQQLY